MLEPREEEDDYDLLTYNEAGARLTEEIAALEGTVTELRSLGDLKALTEAEGRLEALRRAHVRNSRGRLNDAEFEKFFGYPAPPRREVGGDPA